jgi:hypothetical protein
LIPTQTITEALGLLPTAMSSPQAAVLLGAIGAQESEWIYRQQIGGPAHSFWMFEENGIRAVMTHPSSHDYAADLCTHFGLAFSVESVYTEMLTNDLLACAFARLLLWDDVHTLPALGDVQGSWQYYLENWRPGRPRPLDWPANYQAAWEAFA